MTEEHTRVVGISGSAAGSGVTCLCCALANYTTGWLGEKTACVELGEQQVLGAWKETGESGSFVDKEIDFYPAFLPSHIPRLLNSGYQTVLFDFGTAYETCREEILRCSRKVFLLSLDPWNLAQTYRLLETVQCKTWGNIQPVFAALHPEPGCKKKLEKTFHIYIEEIPLLRDPCCVPEEAFSAMNRILGRTSLGTDRKKRWIPGRR